MTERGHESSGVCLHCGYTPGMLGPALDLAEAQTLEDRGYTIDEDRVAEPGSAYFGEARWMYHRAICCRPTWYERLLKD